VARPPFGNGLWRQSVTNKFGNPPYFCGTCSQRRQGQRLLPPDEWRRTHIQRVGRDHSCGSSAHAGRNGTNLCPGAFHSRGVSRRRDRASFYCRSVTCLASSTCWCPLYAATIHKSQDQNIPPHKYMFEINSRWSIDGSSRGNWRATSTTPADPTRNSN
jgi:hypothetical protein